MTQAELAQQLRDIAVQLTKSAGETATLQASVDTLNAKIEELNKIIAEGGAVTPELIEAAAEVGRLAKIVDDNIPDPVPVPSLR
jgi:cell division protein FtsB